MAFGLLTSAYLLSINYYRDKGQGGTVFSGQDPHHRLIITPHRVTLNATCTVQMRSTYRSVRSGIEPDTSNTRGTTYAATLPASLGK